MNGHHRAVGGTRLDAVIFDGEGVVIDTEPTWDKGQEIFLARRGLDYDRDRVKALLTGQSLEDGVRALQNVYGFSGDVPTLARERADIVRDLMQEVEFMPGFQEFFERVRHDYRTCIATAMAEDLLDIIDRRLGIRRMFDGHVYTLADVGFRSKPDPALFLFAAERLGVEPTACVVIEDSPYGIEAAHRAGARAIGLATTYGPELLTDADVVVDSFDDIDVRNMTTER